MSHDRGRIILVDGQEAARSVTARRLRAQGYQVEEAADPATGADLALSDPPDVVVADLWMPSISGVQLCRLLRSEPATSGVPVILCGEGEAPKNRFWAERAGAAAYVTKGRTAELMRALERVPAVSAQEDAFFFQMSGGTVDVRDRIARHLDKALFESVLASEIRGLGNCDSFERLFDLLAQFVSQVSRYRWLALSTRAPGRFALHTHPSCREASAVEARTLLGVEDEAQETFIEDEDAVGTKTGPCVKRTIVLGGTEIGSLAFAPDGEIDDDVEELVTLLAREIGGPLRMALLVEDSQRMATTDALTGLMNRRAFITSMEAELSRARRYDYPLTLLLLDVDHFKQVNDKRGHAAGDRVLSAIGAHLRTTFRRSDFAARWGGEEFVVGLTSTPLEGGYLTAERMREALSRLEIHDDKGELIPVTASVGLSVLQKSDSLDALLDRADRAMYASKSAGRNQVTVAAEDRPSDTVPVSATTATAAVGAAASA
jgi:two-component system cell cycle response regulator